MSDRKDRQPLPMLAPAAADRESGSSRSRAIERARAELEAVFEEGSQIERQGGLDGAATDRIEARLRAIDERLKQDVAAEIAELRERAARLSDPEAPFRPYRNTLVGMLVFGVATPFLVDFVGRGVLGTAIAVAGWAAWAALPIALARAQIKSGVIAKGVFTTYRSAEPVRYWCGVATYLALTLALAFIASFALFAYLDRA